MLPTVQPALMRLIATLFLLASIVTALPSRSLANDSREVEFVRIWPAWRTADSFLRISEYFGGEENTGKETMLRTQTEDRTGFYFLTRTKNEGPSLDDAKFVLEIIKPDSPRTKIYTFPAVIPGAGHVFNLGLTGKDWGGKEMQPVAWRLRLLDAEDHELASQQSFLWKMPDTGTP